MREQRVPPQSDPDAIHAFLTDVSGLLAFDVGANAGDVSEMLRFHFDRVVAFEPCAESFDILIERRIPKVAAVPLALSRAAGKVTLNEYDIATGRFGELVTGDRMAYTWGAQTGSRIVEASTLDREFEIWGVPDFIKIDTEGHELLVIQGGLEGLTAHKPRLLIEVHARENEARIRELLPGYKWALSSGGPNYDLPEFAEYRDEHFYMLGTDYKLGAS